MYGQTPIQFAPLNPAVTNVVPAQKEDSQMSNYTYNTIDMPDYVQHSHDVNVSAPTEASKVRDYLNSRLYDIRYNKVCELQAKFGLVNDPAPTNFDELMERIEKGHYTFEKEEHRKHRYWRDYIIWRDPSVKKDQAGFDAAIALLDDEVQKANDQIAVFDGETGLKAVQAVESFKVSKK